MTTQYFSSQINDIVPFQATYTWPTQSTKVRKQTVKLVPKTGTSALPTEKIEIEFPSDGYLNTQHSRLVFDFELVLPDGRLAETPVTVKAAEEDDVKKGAQMALTAHGVAATTTAANYYAGYVLVLSAADSTGNAVQPGGSTQAYRVLESFKAAATNDVCLKVRSMTGCESNFKLFDMINTTYTAGSPNVPVALSVQGMLYTGIHFGPAGAQEIFEREEVVYGGTQLEDIRARQHLVRGLQSAASNNGFLQSVGALSEGRHADYVKNFQQAQGTGQGSELVPGKLVNIINMGKGKYRYSVSMVSGLFNCNKLIPLKWLAAQWSLRMYLGWTQDVLTTSRALKDTQISYRLSNIHFCAELLQFPETFDTAFFVGLNNGGVPIKFTTWRHHTHNISGAVNHFQIAERARSIKSALCWMHDSKKGTSVDPFRSYFDASLKATDVSYSGAHHVSSNNPDGIYYDRLGGVPSRIQQYQYRVGGTYYPSQPVDCQNGATEAYNELLKTLDGMNDFTYQHGIRPEEWTTRFENMKWASGEKFCMALQFENSDVLPDTITGISGEEQSDLALQVTFDQAPPSGHTKQLNVFLCVDSMIIVEAGNAVKLIM